MSNRPVLAHEIPLRPDVRSIYSFAVADAVRWLRKQPSTEMTGDDSVGWWLLMEIGDFPSSSVLKSLSERLERLATGNPLGSGTIYTYTVMSRTLKRANFPLESVSKLQGTWLKTMEKIVNAKYLDVNHLWLLQMATELWPDLARSHLRTIVQLARIDDPKMLLPSAALTVLHHLNAETSNELGKSVRDRLCSLAKNQSALEELPDWYLAYFVWAMLSSHQIEMAKEFGKRLLLNQKNGAWDSISVECIESTSLCGTAMFDLAMTLKNGQNDWHSCRSKALHEIIMLVDSYNWLWHNWKTIKGMPKIQSKGWALEAFMKKWVQFDKALKVQATDLRGGIDEIDLVLETSNECLLRSLLPTSRFLLVECKHTSQPVGSKDVRAFRDSLMQRRKENCQLGVYISASGFTRDAERALREDYGKSKFVILIDGNEVEKSLGQRIGFSDLLNTKLNEAIVQRP